MTLNWVDTLNMGATYSVYNMADNTLVQDGITATTFTVTGLNANTEYLFGVGTNCSNGDGNVMTISATTSCAPVELPFSEDFSASLSSDACWNGASNITADSALNGGALTLTSNTQWTHCSSESNGLPAGHYRVNIYGTSCQKWMITPEIDFSNVSSPLLTFDAAFTVYTSSSSAPASGFEDNASQKFMVLITTDNSQTWTLLNDINLASLASSSYLTQYVDLSEFAGETVRIAFYGQSLVSGGDNNLHIDNILIEESTGALCLPVSMLAANNVTASEASLSWTGNADSYNVYMIADGDTTFVQNVAETSLDITGLNAMTSYTYGVCAVCGSDESPMTTVTFGTACTALTLPYTETFETTSGTLSCWSVEGAGNWTFGTGDYSASTGAFEGSQNAKITHVVTGNVTKLISPVLDGVQNGLTLDFAYVLRSWSGDVDELRVYARSAADSDWQMYGEYTDATEVWATQTLVIPGTVYQVAFEHTDNYGYGLGLDSVVFATASTPVEDTLTLNLSINNPALGTIIPAPGTFYLALGDTLILTAIPNADVTFNGWGMYLGEVGLGVIPADLNPFPLVVNANMLSLGELDIVAMFSDSTTAPDSLTVIVNTADATMGTTIPAPGIYKYAVGDTVSLTAVPNDGYSFLYWIETVSAGDLSLSDTVTSISGILVVPQMYAGMTLLLTAYFQESVPCETPTNLHASDVDAHSITLGWNTNGNATSWNIRYRVENGEWSSANATTNTYVMNGLQVATLYEIEVQADCGNGNLSDWSEPIHISTTIDGIESWLLNSISLYPNPANDYINVQCSTFNVQSVEVIDVYGKVINTVNVTENPTRINISGLANGIYFVRVTTEQGVATKTFVKK